MRDLKSTLTLTLSRRTEVNQNRQRQVCGSICNSISSRNGSGSGGGFFLVKFLVWTLLLLSYEFGVSEGCPLVCICKWKSGKQTVECQNQNLNTLPDEIDAETQVLDISGNKLQVLPRDAFRRAGLLNLQRIYVRNSRLRQIDPGAFNELINLVEIDLSDNLLTAVPTAALRATPFLRELNLAGNPIVQIQNGAFEFVSQLLKLDLSRSHLTQIEDFAFSQLKLLESLKITSNQLKTLSNYTVKSLSQLHGVELHDNPWECDCRLRDFKSWIENNKIPHPVSPVCQTPTRLAGRKFSDLPVSEFACQPRIILDASERHIRVQEEENATLECIVDSTPVTSIRWYCKKLISFHHITNNTMISAQRKFVIYEDEMGRSALTLTNALEKDSGDFVCVVENPAGSTEANFTLEIVPRPPFPTLPTSQVVLIAVGLVFFLLFLTAIVLFTFWRRRVRESLKPPEILASSTPVKPPRLNYDINPGSLLPNGYGNKSKADATDNPDLILETNNTASHQLQEMTLEEQSSNSELNWEQQSYRNMGYSSEYPPDYGLPIIHENSVYSENLSYYAAPTLNHSNHSNSNHSNSHSHSGGGGGGGGGGSGSTGGIGSMGVGNVLLSGVWGKNKVGTRIIRAPSARDSPDEGYQEGYCGTDV